MNGQKFCLKWDHFRSSVTSVFNNLRQDEELVDITLCCEGHKLKAHRMMLSACSPYFRELLKENPCQHPVFFLKDTSAEDLRAVIEFVYNGEVNVAQTQLASFIKTAEMLQIRGLSGEDEDSLPAVPSSAPPPERRPAPPPPPPPAPPEVARSPAAKRRRRSASPEVVSRPAAPPPPPPPPPLSRPPQQQQQSMAHSQQSHSQHSQQSQQSQSQSQQLSQQVEMAAVDQGRLPPQSPADIKVEKVDLTDADDDPSLEAALGRVVSYEGAEADLSSLTADDSLGEAGPSGGLSGDRSMQAHSESDASTMPTVEVFGGGFRCQKCKQQLDGVAAFLQHYKEKHSPEVTCPSCGVRFASPYSMKRHATTCPKRMSRCSVVLSTPAVKKPTVPRKTADKPPVADADGMFRCDGCERRFRALDSLRRHAAAQHGEEEEWHPPACEERVLEEGGSGGTGVRRPVRQRRRRSHCSKLGCDCGGEE